MSEYNESSLRLISYGMGRNIPPTDASFVRLGAFLTSSRKQSLIDNSDIASMLARRLRGHVPLRAASPQHGCACLCLGFSFAGSCAATGSSGRGAAECPEWAPHTSLGLRHGRNPREAPTRNSTLKACHIANTKDDFHCKATENGQLSMGDRLPQSGNRSLIDNCCFCQLLWTLWTVWTAWTMAHVVHGWLSCPLLPR
jgi:hypothetical protein